MSELNATTVKSTTTEAATLKSKAALTVPVVKDSNDVEIGQFCRVWVNFDHVTATIRDSFNVSSITDVSTGNATITFTNALPNANYLFLGTSSNDLGSGAAFVSEDNTASPPARGNATINDIDIEIRGHGGTLADKESVNAAILSNP